MKACPCNLNRVACWLFHGPPTWGWWVVFAAVMFGWCTLVAWIGSKMQ